MGSLSDTKTKMPSQTTDREVDIVSDDAIEVPGYDADIQFESSEARKALLKVDFFILPAIVLCFCFLQFDRTNIGNALTDTLRADIHVGNSDINLAQTLFTVGFVITELPFNMISKYMGPERFLPITMFLWGTVTWAQIFIKNATGLCVARFFIGALEGGYIPGFALYISKYYTNQELALRYAIFWASNSFAGALGGPLSIGLLSLRGRGGLAGWQWLFLIGTFSPLFLPLTQALKLTTTRRGYFDMLPRSVGVPVFPSRGREAQVLLRQVLQPVHSARSIHHRDSSHPQRSHKGASIREASSSFSHPGNIYGLEALWTLSCSSTFHGHDCSHEHICSFNHQVSWIHWTASKRSQLGRKRVCSCVVGVIGLQQ